MVLKLYTFATTLINRESLNPIFRTQEHPNETMISLSFPSSHNLSHLSHSYRPRLLYRAELKLPNLVPLILARRIQVYLADNVVDLLQDGGRKLVEHGEGFAVLDDLLGSRRSRDDGTDVGVLEAPSQRELRLGHAEPICDGLDGPLGQYP